MKNLRRLACKFVLDQSDERKSSQVNARARKPSPNGVASRRKLKTWVYLRLRLARLKRCVCVFFFLRLACTCEETCESVWPPNKVSTQVRLASTCRSVWSGLNLHSLQKVKPWPNGVASSRKLRTWVYLRHCLAGTCVHLR